MISNRGEALPSVFSLQSKHLESVTPARPTISDHTLWGRLFILTKY